MCPSGFPLHGAFIVDVMIVSKSVPIRNELRMFSRSPSQLYSGLEKYLWFRGTLFCSEAMALVRRSRFPPVKISRSEIINYPHSLCCGVYTVTNM